MNNDKIVELLVVLRKTLSESYPHSYDPMIKELDEQIALIKNQTDEDRFLAFVNGTGVNYVKECSPPEYGIYRIRTVVFMFHKGDYGQGVGIK
jgi:hypothetical protein